MMFLLNKKVALGTKTPFEQRSISQENVDSAQPRLCLAGIAVMVADCVEAEPDLRGIGIFLGN
jgi:hypothetical protein